MNEKKISSFFGKLFSFGKKDEEVKKEEIANGDMSEVGGAAESENTTVPNADLLLDSHKEETIEAEKGESRSLTELGGDYAIDESIPDKTDINSGESSVEEVLPSEESVDLSEEQPAEPMSENFEIPLADTDSEETSEQEKTLEENPEFTTGNIEKDFETLPQETAGMTVENPEQEKTLEEKPEPGNTLEENPEQDEPDASSVRSGGLDMFETAKIFGVSEERLENEFKLYKVDKVAKKTELMLCDQYIGTQETVSRIKAAISAKLSSVTVLPSRLKCALDAAEKKIPVSVAVCYPLGADDFRTRKYAVKKAAATAASGIEIPFDPTAERGMNYKLMLKDYKKIVRAARKKPVTVILEASSYTDTELMKIVSVLKEAGVKRIKSSAGNKNAVTCAYADKNLAEAASGKLTVVCCAKDYTPEGLVKAFSFGADYVSSKNAVEAINSLRSLLVGSE